MNLFELSARFQQLLDKDEYTPEEMAELESLHASIEDACVERAKYIKNLEAMKEAVKKEIGLMQERYKDLNNKTENQREKLINIMQSNKLNKIDHPVMRIIIPKPRASVEILDESLIANGYCRTETKTIKYINKDAIKLTLETGGDVEGARLNYNLNVNFK